MNPTPNWFEQLAVNDWSKAVFEAAHRFAEVRADILAALAAPNAEIRSAAVAALNEANDIEAHDEVVALLEDTNPHVQEEVLEYIEQFPAKSDAAALLKLLQGRKFLFLASSALQKLYGNRGPLISGDEPAVQIAGYVERWEILVSHEAYRADNALRD